MDTVSRAAGICAFVGIMNLICGGVLVSGVVDSTLGNTGNTYRPENDPGVLYIYDPDTGETTGLSDETGEVLWTVDDLPPPGAGGSPFRLLGLITVAGALVYLGLAFGIKKESGTCAFLAAVLYTGDSYYTLSQMGWNPGGIGVRTVFAIALWKGAYDLMSYSKSSSFSSASAKDWRPPPPTGNAPTHLSGGSTSKSGRQPPAPPPPPPGGSAPPPEKPKKQAPKSGGKLCPNCMATYPSDTERCSKCNVVLVRN